MARYISVGSNGDSSIPSYEVCCSQRTTSMNFSTLASFTSLVQYMFRRKVVRVCAIPLGVVCICPVLKEYMVRSERRRFFWKMWYIVCWYPSGLSASLLSSGIFCSLLLCSRTIFAFRRFKAGSIWSLGPGLCNTSYMHSYKWFSIIQWSLRRSACSRWYSCRIFFLQRRSHHIVRSGKHPFCRCSCPHRVPNFSLHAFSAITAVSIFHSPRLLRIIGSSIDIRRHTARWSINGATMASKLSFLLSSSRVA